MANRFQRFREELIDKANFVELYTEFGLEIVGTNPTASGWLTARSHEKFGGKDSSPSAGINIITGLYKDFRTGRTLSIFDFMAEIGETTNYREAQKVLGQRFQVKLPSLSKSHPEHGVVWKDWKDGLVEGFCKRKPPITLEGLKKSGAMLCTRHDQPAIAWAMYNEDMDVVGYYFLPRNATMFDGKDGPKPSVCKKFDHQEAGLIGRPAVERLVANRHPDLQARFNEDHVNTYEETIWLEGVTDMLAAYSQLPGDRFVTNGNGAGEGITDTMVKILKHTNQRVLFVGDFDAPGRVGALKKARKLSAELQRNKTNKWDLKVGAYSLFAENDPKATEGDDLRDFLIRYADELAEDQAPCPVSPVTLGGLPLFTLEDPERIKQIAKEGEQIESGVLGNIDKGAETIMRELELKVLKIEPGNKGYVYGCRTTGKTLETKSLGALKYPDLTALTGTKGIMLISRGEELEHAQRFKFAEVVDAMSIAASKVADSAMTTVGEGVWRVEDAEKKNEYRLALVKNGHFYFPNGTLQFHEGPSYGNYFANYAAKTDWFDVAAVDKYLELAKDIGWRQEVNARYQKILGGWNWAYEDMPLLVSGLTYATRLQTIWRWRPIVILTGESESGKSYFLEMLDELFLGEGQAMGAGSAAGVLQQLRDNAMQCFLDEFDKAREQKKLFEAFRLTSRGQTFYKGTASQKAMGYKLAHIPWLCGIAHGAEEQADLNRLIPLHQLKVPGGLRTINRPDRPDALDLGHQLLAISLQIGLEARDLAHKLATTGYRSRYRESYAVPFACLGALSGLDFEATNQALEDYLLYHQKSELDQSDSTNDQEDLLRDVMSATVRLPNEAPVLEPTVAQMLSETSRYSMFWDYLPSKGLEVKSRSGVTEVCLDIGQMVRQSGLLGRTKYLNSGSMARQILKRLEGSIKPVIRNTRVAGKVCSALCFDIEALRTWMNLEAADRKRRLVEASDDDVL